MNKESENVGRLGSQANEEYRNGGMRSMSTEAGQNEPGAYDGNGEDQGILPNYAAVVATLSAALVGTIVICIIISRMWDEDEIKLHMLNFLTRVLQAVARLAGSWAIECENAYNDHVNALH